ncbi:DNA-binding protein [Thiothrix subterranea]|uniref:DNA-binding protein n=1 Tax=Thiothrix subterranea TaxID=2735563 RepID=UPI00192B4F80|nr:DNA-binding protein [Thiothrix subterranea]QQZ30792.1 DNA-binding protein [Thiothrix subterranea]
MALTKDQIQQAADLIALTGESPTLAAVRKAVGGGSYTTINEALKEWKAKQQALITPSREPAPDNITKRLNKPQEKGRTHRMIKREEGGGTLPLLPCVARCIAR